MILIANEADHFFASRSLHSLANRGYRIHTGVAGFHTGYRF